MSDDIWKIRYPFDGHFAVTFPFGATSTNDHINHKLSQLRLKGHSGMDFGLPVGTPVKAVYEGVVSHAGDLGSYGKTIIIKHSWGESLYAHLADIHVTMGKHVHESDHIGASGDSGYTFGPHLHFAIRPNNHDPNNGFHGYIDPQPHLTKMNGGTHPEGSRNIAVTFGCFIKRDDSYLMLKRDADKRILPGVLMAPGGKREENEGLFAAAKRELKEKTGLDIQNIRIRTTGSVFLADIGQELFMHHLLADAGDGQVNKSCDDGQLVWMKKDEILGHDDTLSEVKKLGDLLFDESEKIASFVAVYSSGNTLESFTKESES